MVGAMVALAVFAAIGMVVDDRVLLGESVWLKPFKFAVAFTVYGLTLAWLLSLPHRGARVTWWFGLVFAVTAAIDVGFIVLQAARGTFSHFDKAGDPVNSIGQQVFAAGVPGLFIANLVIALIISWQQVADRPISRAIKAGLGIAVAGMFLGYLMGFTGKRIERDANGNLVQLAGGHTKFANGPEPGRYDGLPITHWSTVAGDLRVPHFLGLHGIQALLLAALVLSRLASRVPWLREERTRARIVGVLACGYAGVVAITLWQALRAQSLIHPDATTLAACGALGALVLVCLTAIAVRAHSAQTLRLAGQF
ncbi:hypothetical protein D5S18_27825 [Nocardia panacis]|uniref:Uncharacterized protein n=2 Tax=Nocardia panacis TaxID=2340916 RepID=A0A3A4K3F2_9NOCA|nr:hypothetical protein D5S18_27825 [Nocardia panacis]